MSLKTVYVKISDRLECIEFNVNTTTDDLKGKLKKTIKFYNKLFQFLFFSQNNKETFRCAAEANQHDILKLYNWNGNMVSISNTLASNTSKEPYRLEVIVKSVGKLNLF